MEPQMLRDGPVQVEVTQQETGTGPRLRVRSLPQGTWLDLDPLELEGLTRLPFIVFAELGEASATAGELVAVGPPEAGMEVLRNEFAMVAVAIADEPNGSWLRVRNLASGAEVRLRAGQLDRLTRLRHRDLAPLVDPSGLLSEAEPDPDQV
jgi:hypothetical protein